MKTILPRQPFQLGSRLRSCKKLRELAEASIAQALD